MKFIFKSIKEITDEWRQEKMESTRREVATDIAALGVLTAAVYMAMTAMPMPEYFSTVLGAAVAYLFIKNSPNTV